jgi:hypothetical protein
MENLTPSDSTVGVVPVVVPRATALVPLNPKVLIALPWQKQLSPVTAFCVSQLMDQRRTASALAYGDAFVAHSRNSLADHFLASKHEWILQIDDDMVIPFGNSDWYRAFTGFTFAERFMTLNALDRLLSHGKSLVGALYFGRHKGANAVYNEAGSNPAENEYAKKGPYDFIKVTRWVGTGCMLAHRTVFEDIEKQFPRLARSGGKHGGNWFTSTEATLLDNVTRLRDAVQGKPLTGEIAYSVLSGLTSAIAIANHENPLGSGEDVSFCLRAQAAGHTPHVDMGLRCGHIGHYVY